MNLHLKHPNSKNGEFFLVEDSFWVINDRRPDVKGICEEEETIEKIKRNENGWFDFNKSFIDIGAEDGNYAMLLDFDKNYCFEPNKSMCCLIYTNMYMKNKVNNTEVYNLALGEKEGENIIFNGWSEIGSPLFKNCIREEEHVIQKTTLDSFNLKNIGFIKTDTEGFDLQVLKGGLKTIIDNNYPPILFENWDVGFWDGWTKEKHDMLNNFLTSIGYTIFPYWGNLETHLAVKI